MVSVGPILNARVGSPYPFYGPNPAGCYVTVGSASWRTWLRLGPLVSVACLGLMALLYLAILFKVRADVASEHRRPRL